MRVSTVICERGLFATKNIDAGALILVTKAIAMERSIIMGGVQDLCEDAQLAMWKNFIDKVFGFDWSTDIGVYEL